MENDLKRDDLIRRSDALTEFEKVCAVCMALVARPMCGECSVADTVRKVKHIPAVDAVEVVRCGDCVHLNRVHMNISGNYRCDRYEVWQDESNRVHMPWTGFCSFGQRREDGDT